jgi:two-component system, response regulator PdtaR
LIVQAVNVAAPGGGFMAAQRYDFCIGSADINFKRIVSAALSRAGFYSAGDAKSIPLFLRLIRTVQPWLAVVDTELPPGNIVELADIIESDGLAAAIYINTAGVNLSRYVELNWPVDPAILTAVANAVCTEFAGKKRMHMEIASLQQKLNDRKLVDRAKNILIKTNSISEEEAFRFLQKTSMDKRISMAETAVLIIKCPGAFSSLSQRR